MEKSGILFVVLAVIIVAGLFFGSAWLLMTLVNVIIGQYNGTLLTYQSAVAANLLLWVFGGAVRGNK